MTSSSVSDHSEWTLFSFCAMDGYSRIVFILSASGFLKEFRPSEPYLSPFLNGLKNFTETQITNHIYPVATYSQMALLVVVFLLTDWLKYKPVIILQGVSGVITSVVFLWCQGIPWMQLAQIAYGLFSAAEVAFFSYLYAKIDKKCYQKATAQTKSALLIAKASSAFVAQILVMCHILNYEQLNYLTLSAMSIGTILTFFLPPAQQSIYFHRTADKYKGDALPLNELDRKDITDEKPSYCLKKIFWVWKNSMCKAQTMKWSIWSTLFLCGSLQIFGYIQLLWQDVINNSESDQKLYHGFSVCFNSLSGAACTYAVGYLKLDWAQFGEMALAVAALLQGGLILLVSCADTGLVLHYVVFAVFKILYYVSSTIVSSEVAKSLDCDSYGLVLGANQFFALVAQSILTVLVNEVFDFEIKTKFFLYGAYFMVLGFGFVISGAVTLRKPKKIFLQ